MLVPGSTHTINKYSQMNTENCKFKPWIIYGPIAVWLLFWFGSLIGYIFSGLEEYVPWCIPHFEGCTSVSKAGRYGTSFYLFKILLIPATILLFIYWIDVYRWQRFQQTLSARLPMLILISGCLGAVFLIAHLTALGLDCEICRTFRNYGTKGFFVFTIAAQWMLYFHLRSTFSKELSTRCLFVVCVLVTFEMLLSGTVQFFWEDTRWIENGIAWRSTFYLSFAPFLVSKLWKC